VLKRIKDLVLKANRIGLPLPMAHDSVTGKPSVTLLMFYTGLVSSIISIAMLHDNPDKYLSATLVTLLFLSLGFVFYRLRNLDKVKLDLDDRSIELEGGEDEQTGSNAGSSGENKPSQE
jgi:hypothetical protein